MNLANAVPSNLATLALLLVAACSNPAENVPAAFVGEPLPAVGTEVPLVASGAPGAVAGETTGAAVRTFTFGRGGELGTASSVTFHAAKVTRSHIGGFQEFSGDIRLVDGTPEGSRVRVEIATPSLVADRPALTTHLKSGDFFEVETFPTATFESSRIVQDGAGYAVTGNLTMHGVTKSITFPADISVGEDQVTAQAKFFVKRFDWGITYPGAVDDLIRDEVVIALNIVATPT